MGIAKTASISIILSLVSTTSKGGSLSSVDLEDMAQILRSDVRVIVMGDSFSTPIMGRVPIASLLAWPIPKISALCGGALQEGQFIRALASCSPTESLLWSDELRYRILRSSKLPQVFSLPVRAVREIYTDENFTSGIDGRLFTFRFDQSVIQSGVHGSFAGSDDRLKFRMLYWASPDTLNTSVQEIEIRDLNTSHGIIDLHHQARGFWHLGDNPSTDEREVVPLQINATSQDFLAMNDLNGTFRIRVHETSLLAGTNKYFHPAGGLYYHVDELGERIPGFYFSYMSDGGWRYSGFGCDCLPIVETDKQFTEEQFTHWLDVTTIDRDQPVVFYWYLSAETLSYSDVKVRIEAMIDQANISAARVGITEWHHLLVMPHMYNIGGLGDVPEAHAWMQGNRDAMFDVATERSDVAFASIYDATNGMFFDGTDAGNNWLDENGFTTFEHGTVVTDLVNGESLGDLLDNLNLHPANSTAGSFFAAVLGEIIREAGCHADLAVNGVIDVNDLLIIIAAWDSNDDGDVNQDGITDIHDLLIVIAAWGDCWPVQAPFNSTGN